MSFKGIWIPIELMNLNISWTKRILIAEISQLEMLDKGCIASNSHFSDKLKLSKQAVSKALNELNLEGIIKIDNAQTKRNFGRTITINFSKSPINFSKSGIHESGESKENKQSNKTLTEYESFLSQLEKACKFKSKVTKTKEGEKLFKQIKDIGKLFNDYIDYQKERGNFSVRITDYMKDYDTVHSVKEDIELTDEEFWSVQGNN